MIPANGNVFIPDFSKSLSVDVIVCCLHCSEKNLPSNLTNGICGRCAWRLDHKLEPLKPFKVIKYMMIGVSHEVDLGNAD